MLEYRTVSACVVERCEGGESQALLVVCQLQCVVFFFFSSRRRHTRFDCDWSSDVCSSDLAGIPVCEQQDALRRGRPEPGEEVPQMQRRAVTRHVREALDRDGIGGGAEV